MIKIRRKIIVKASFVTAPKAENSSFSAATPFLKAEQYSDLNQRSPTTRGPRST